MAPAGGALRLGGAEPAQAVGPGVLAERQPPRRPARHPSPAGGPIRTPGPPARPFAVGNEGLIPRRYPGPMALTRRRPPDVAWPEEARHVGKPRRGVPTTVRRG